jgi:TonB family protein
MCHLRAILKCGLPLQIVVAALTFVSGLAAGALWDALRPAEAPLPTPTMTTTTRTVSVTTTDGSVDYPRRFSATQTVSGGILNGRAKSLPAPAYPEAARRARAAGMVVVKVVVGEDGRVVMAGTDNGHPLLGQAALEAARAAVFAPTRLEGRPVKVSGLLTYEFAPE